MVTNKKPTGRAVSMPVGLAMGGIIALLWTVLGSMLVAKLIESEVMQESSVGYGAGGILLVGAFLASMVSFRKIKHQRVLVCMISGAVYFVCLLGITALFFGGQYQAVGVTGLLILAGSGTAALLGLNSGGGKRHSGYRKIR